MVKSFYFLYLLNKNFVEETTTDISNKKNKINEHALRKAWETSQKY